MNSTTILVEKYGLLLNVGQVAEILKRTPDGIRFTIRSKSDLGEQLRHARIKIGRRILFKTEIVASIFDSN